MEKRTKIIQDLIDANGYQSYLEIGLGDGHNFRSVKCNFKVGVDPEYNYNGGLSKSIINEKSDQYFKRPTSTFDIIFIDGLHHSDQVERDIVNSYKVLNKGGIILIHDCIPWEEKISRVPRETITWTGNVFQAVCGFYKKYGQKIKMQYFDERTGIIGIWKTGKYKVELGFNKPELTYEEFDLDWKETLRSL